MGTYKEIQEDIVEVLLGGHIFIEKEVVGQFDLSFLCL